MKLNRRVVWITPRPGELGEVYYLTDGLGSTMALTDAAGDVDTAWDYDVFGAVRDTSGSQPNDYQFAGEQVDGSTDLQYLRARYYDPAVGRFMSLDPIEGILGLPSSQNRYVYVLNRPVGLVDPSGLCAFGAPCPKPLKKAGAAVSGFVENTVGYAWEEIEDAYGPPYSLSKIIQIVDSVPLLEAGCVAIAAAALPAGVACLAVAQAANVASVILATADTWKTDCSVERKLAATGLNIGNFLVDFPPFLKPLEPIVYVASTSVLDCNPAGNGKE